MTLLVVNLNDPQDRKQGLKVLMEQEQATPLVGPHPDDAALNDAALFNALHAVCIGDGQYGEQRQGYLRMAAHAGHYGITYAEAMAHFNHDGRAYGGVHSSIEQTWRSHGGEQWAPKLIDDVPGKRQVMYPGAVEQVLALLDPIE